MLDAYIIEYLLGVHLFFNTLLYYSYLLQLFIIFRNMTTFRLAGEDFMLGSSVHQIQPQIPQMKMMKVHIPFTFKLQETSKSSYSGKFTVTGYFSCCIYSKNYCSLSFDRFSFSHSSCATVMKRPQRGLPSSSI